MSATAGYHAMRVYFAVMATEQIAVNRCKAEQARIFGYSEPEGLTALAAAEYRLVKGRTECIIRERLARPLMGSRATLFMLDRELHEVKEVCSHAVTVAEVWDGVTKSYMQEAMAALGMTGEPDFYKAAGVKP